MAGTVAARRFASMLVLIALAGCGSFGQGGAGAAVGGTSGPVPPGSSPAASGVVGTPTPTPAVLEDAGVDTPLAAGTYSSRLFEPNLRLELGAGWVRDGPGGPIGFRLRHGLDGEEELGLFTKPDFLQCGGRPVIPAPPAPLAAAEIATEPSLDVRPPRPEPVGERTGIALELMGGDPLPEDAYAQLLAFGCVLSFGPEAFPAEAANILALSREMRALVVLLDVDGTTVVAVARPGRDPDAFFATVLEVLAVSSFD